MPISTVSKRQSLVFSGRHREGCQTLLNYLRLNPHDARNWAVLNVITIARYMLADYLGAVEAARRSATRLHVELLAAYLPVELVTRGRGEWFV
jgi:hypothetical protein